MSSALLPSDLNLPPKFKEFREGQLEAALQMAYSNKYAFLYDGPPGTGKSCTAATVQRLLGKKIVYLTMTKQLQNQILSEFSYAKTLKGRSSYPCEEWAAFFPDITAEDCVSSEDKPCKYSGNCHYLYAKKEALKAPIAVLNTAYFLSEANFVGQFSGTDLLILDEVDMVDESLLSFIEFSISKKQLERWSITKLPEFKTKFESWKVWASDTVSYLSPQLDGMWDSIVHSGRPSVQLIRRYKALVKFISKLEFFIREVDDSWIWQQGQNEWSFKPIWVSKYAQEYLWQHAKQVIGMSGTILSPKQVCSNLGLARDAYEYMAVTSPFPASNRPIYYRPCANLVKDEMIVELPKLAKGVQEIMNEFPNGKILVHTSSYDISKYLMANISTDRFVTHSSFDRDTILETFKKSVKPLVLLSPSMVRGVDMPGIETCSVVIVAKVPFLNLGDPQINARVYRSTDGSSWYAHKAVSSIHQSVFRHIRSMTDKKPTFLLDRQFERLFDRNRAMFAQWFIDALHMDGK
jgi:ATP-dependent DNA helicase DinG